MENLADVSQVIGASTTFLDALLFIWLSTVPRISPGVRWWTAGLVISLLGFLIYTLPHLVLNDVDISGHIYFVSELFFAVCISIGTRQFAGRSVNTLMYASATAATIIVALTFDFVLSSFLGYFTVISVFNGTLILTTGYTIFKHTAEDWWYWPQAIGVVFMVWGLHWLDAPLMMQVDWLFDYGFIFALLISNMAILGYAALMLHSLIVRILSAEKMAIELSLKDSLTLLWNRRYLDNIFTNFKHNAQRHNHKMAVIYIDLDHFKPVNDTLGHEAGDEVLRQVAQRITEISRTSDVTMRVGGDEFVVFVPQLDAGESVVPQAARLRECIAAPFKINSEIVQVGASIGVAIFPDHAMELDHLLERADHAMYAVKKVGRNNVGLFDQGTYD